jgi:hypothetical protein
MSDDAHTHAPLTSAATGEPTLADIEAEFPGWHAWKGIAGLCYARKMLSSPPVVIRAEDAVDLRDQIRGWLGRHDPLL